MVLSKLNTQKLISQHTRGRYTFQPLWVSDIVHNQYTGIVLRVRPLTDSVRGPGKQRLPPNHKSWRRTAGINEDQRKTFYKTCYPFRDLSRLHHQPVKFLFRQLLPLQIFQPNLTEIRHKQAHLKVSWIGCRLLFGHPVRFHFAMAFLL